MHINRVKFSNHLGKVSLLIILIIVPLLILSQLQPYYDWAFQRYQVYANFDNEITASQNWDELLEYLRPPFNIGLDPMFFGEADVLHMQDVRRLFQILWVLLAISLTTYIYSTLTNHSLSIIKLSKAQLLLITSLISVLIPFIAWQWQPLFFKFHQLLFPHNNYWLLDPAASNLIKYFTNHIFLELTILYLIMLVFSGFGFSMISKLSSKVSLEAVESHP